MPSPSLAALGKESYISLATFRKNGSEVATPVWHVLLEDKLYVFTEASSYKVKRLRHNPAVKVAPCGTFGAVKGDWVTGQATIVNDCELSNRVYAALDHKYGWQMTLINVLSSIAGRISDRAVLEISLDCD